MKTLLLLFILTFIHTQDPADLVTSLPDYPYKGRMYSGYLDLNDQFKKYHYIFMEAYEDSYNAPLLLWLNGGPGCSSLLGWITEIGPALFKDYDEFMTLNNYTWHKLANIIYLESPGNVGFSYIDSSAAHETYIDDEITARENLEALLSFFKKFPSLKKNDLYLSGESYAGVYIPRLAEKVIDYNNKVPSSKAINLKGFTIGNARTSQVIDGKSALYDFAFTHSLYSYEMRKEYLEVCQNSIDVEKCNAIKGKILDLLDGLFMYDLLQDCGRRKDKTEQNEKSENNFYQLYAKWAFEDDEDETTPKFLNDIIKNKRFGETVCEESDAPIKYLNRDDVKAALHVKTDIKWNMCNYGVVEKYVRSKEASLYLYPKLIQSGLKIWIFSGDTDMVIPYNGSQRWIDSLGLEVVSPWRSWRAFNDMTTIAGYRTIYKGLTFVTVKGTGHMVAQWKQKEAFYMFQQFLKGEDL